MPPRLFCGEALCKAPLTLPAGAAPRWPIRCLACGTPLYPADVLARLPPDEVEPKRAEVMTERAGARVPIQSAELSPNAGAEGGDVDRILAMVELDPAGAEARRARRTGLVVGVVVLAIVVLAIAVRLLAFRT